MLRYKSRATDRCTVILRKIDTSARSRYVEIDRVSITARIMPLSQAEIDLLGASGVKGALETRKLFCASFPGDLHAQVIDGSGVLWDVIAEPQHSQQLRKPQSTVMIRRVG